MEAKSVNCEAVQGELMDWLAGTLPAEQCWLLEKHLGQCPACRQELAAAQALWTSLGQLPVPEPSEQLRPRFYSMLADFQAQEERRQSWSVAGWLERLRQWWQPAYALRLAYGLALLTIGLVGGYSLRSRPETSGAGGQELAATEQPAADTRRQQVVLAMLADPSAVQRLRAVGYAGEEAHTNEHVVAALLSTLNQDPNVNVRLAALDVLSGLTNDPVVRQGLVRSLPRQDSPMVQAALADVMVQLQERGAKKPLQQLLRQDDLNEQVKDKLEQSLETLSNDPAPPPSSTPTTSHETPDDTRTA
ncbi:HEAT repeat domain-containing protein [Hymenobacter gummosus]|uniref:HEAT repeat domain-containing protein n=1 Tax=Hymenobacter gummosus TaxID=1776032 RepID=A0A3S0K1M3_9BACT|nr:HEAT repeat domain-containing protein [Hymenobacter gummosus]RTQ45820.1 HEAT repeat domain-containing protein [Hymenobacter gummosus]